MSRPLPSPPIPSPPAAVFRTGRIRVVCSPSSTKSSNGYVSSKLPAYGCFEVTPHEASALRVMYNENSAGGVFDLTLLVSERHFVHLLMAHEKSQDCNANFEFLGVSWLQAQPSIQQGSTEYVVVTY